ncbi:D-glycero-alpha-D-manno-heptose-1,7-bisphosphate 7-phosphatase [Kitasatospora sp. NPDC089509]|uniref:D-glycero-alpha-D-manno-heptose-1,7-bisphosphate 7-phosphatase n=1 Tax=Kitasatospora sp. NPDC089509 TaxID=3364079 RepID=UPI00382E88C9
MTPAAIVLDRDGVLNELWRDPDLGLVDSPLNPAQVRLRPGAAGAVRRINEAGVPCYVASNQPGIAKRKMTPRLLGAVTRRLLGELGARNARLDGIAYCLHHPDAVHPALRRDCPDRKPGPGMLLRIAHALDVPPGRCWFVGDNPSDVAAGRAAGFRTAWIGTTRCDTCPTRTAHAPDLVAADLDTAVTHILEGTTDAALPRLR